MPDGTSLSWQSSPRSSWRHLLGREVQLFLRFTWRDHSAAIIPALLFMMAAVKASAPRQLLLSLLIALARGLPYFALFLYSFCLSNQISGVEEDRINKPDRPLPAGLVSLEGAKLRWLVLMGLYPVVAFMLGGLGLMFWAVVWQVLSVLHNSLGWSTHWALKNLVVMTLGTLAQLAQAWLLVAELTPLAWRWILVISVSVGLTISIQDFRDVEGDRSRGRRTLPICVGDLASRYALSALCLLLPIVTSLLLRGAAGLTPIALFPSLMSLGFSLCVAVRLLCRRCPQEDHTTYMLWTYWYCVEVASALFVLP